MIDLTQTRSKFLDDIGAPYPLPKPAEALASPQNPEYDHPVCVRGHTRKDLFPLLKAHLTAWYSYVPRADLLRDLLIPLRNAIGNSYRHGNGNDPNKEIEVNILHTRGGLLVSVTDEGHGFNPEHIFKQFRDNEFYFVNNGHGFNNFQCARSTISYADNGRTFLLCFRAIVPCIELVTSSDPAPVPGPERQVHSPTSIHSEAWDGEESGNHPLPSEISAGAQFPELMRVYETRGPATDGCGNRYVMRVAERAGHGSDIRIVTGRVHGVELTAEADFKAASDLYSEMRPSRIFIPRPLAKQAGPPFVVLYDFDPWMNLREYLLYRRNLTSLYHSAERVGGILSQMHSNRSLFPDRKTSGAIGKLLGMISRAGEHLQKLKYEHPAVNLFYDMARRALERASTDGQCFAPIHGAMNWNSIWYGVDGRFYLYHFESCQWSDPGLDLGGYIADLLQFTHSVTDGGTYQICLSALLNSYNAGAEVHMSEPELHFYTILALSERHAVPANGSGALLRAALNAALHSWN